MLYLDITLIQILTEILISRKVENENLEHMDLIKETITAFIHTKTANIHLVVFLYNSKIKINEARKEPFMTQILPHKNLAPKHGVLKHALS